MENQLYRTFAETDPTRDAILSFVNRYGLLGSRPISPRRQDEPEISKVDPFELTELFWSRQINRMKELLILADLCNRGDEDGLSDLVRWSNKRDKVSYLTPRLARFEQGKDLLEREVVIAERGKVDDQNKDRSGVEDFLRFTPGNPILPALTYIQREINKRIDEERIRTQLLWDEVGRLGLRLVPETLLQALWLQFAGSISGNFAYRPCVVCGR